MAHEGLPMNFCEAIKTLEICDRRCNLVNSCPKLEICHQFLFSGKCLFHSYEEGSCRFGHDLKTKHNFEVLKGKGLEELRMDDLRRRLILLKRNIPCIPICERYNSNESHKNCVAMHICYKYLYGTCEKESCHLSHDLTKENCPLILENYGIMISESDVESLLKDFKDISNRPSVDVARLLLEYNCVQLLNSGSFGDVYEAQHVLDKKTYAVKCIPLDGKGDPGESQSSGAYEEPQNLQEAVKEVHVLASLKHENIVQYYTAWIDKSVVLPDESRTEFEINYAPGCKCLYIQMELCQKETLETVVYEKMKSNEQLEDIFYQMVKAIDYLHSKGIMHRDLKPNNVFFEKDSCKVKVGDFGLAKIHNVESNKQIKHTSNLGFKMYSSPEMRAGEPYTKLTDIYSLGIIAVLMFHPLKTKIEWVEVNKQTTETGRPPEEIDVSGEMRNLISRMLMDQSQRITANELLQQLEQMRRDANKNQ